MQDVSKKNVVDVISKYVKSVAGTTANDVAKESVKRKKGKVVSYDEANMSALVEFPDDGTGDTYKFYNKTGEGLEEGEYVWIEYTSNPAKGILNGRLGAPATNSAIMPVTAIKINGNGDFTLSTNAGTERYVAIFEE